MTNGSRAWASLMEEGIPLASRQASLNREAVSRIVIMPEMAPRTSKPDIVGGLRIARSQDDNRILVACDRTNSLNQIMFFEITAVVLAVCLLLPTILM